MGLFSRFALRQGGLGAVGTMFPPPCCYVKLRNLDQIRALRARVCHFCDGMVSISGGREDIVQLSIYGSVMELGRLAPLAR